MNVNARLDRLERTATPEDTEVVVLCGLFGRAAPGQCADVLIEIHRLTHPSASHRFVDLFDAEGKCLACGELHEVPT